MNNFIEEFESIIQKEDFPANPEYSAEKIKKRRIIIYGAGNGLITLSIFVLQRFDIKCETILDRKYAEPELCDGIILCHPDKFVPDTETMEHALVIISLGDQILKKSVKKQLYLHFF